MASQLSLDDFRARLLARRDDPMPSKEAARRLVRSGKLNRQQQTALTALRLHPGTTAWEMAEGNTLLRFMLCRRLPELVRKGAAKRGAPRVCRITGTKQTTWWPASLV